MSLFRNQDLLTHCNTHTFLAAANWRGYFFVYHYSKGNMQKLARQHKHKLNSNW